MADFETMTCSRCGGTGHYSFNLMDGTVCYGCNGRGWKYTRRGAAAKKFYDDSLTINAADADVGMLVWLQGGMFNRAQWGRIIEVSVGAPTSTWSCGDGVIHQGSGIKIVCEFTKKPGEFIEMHDCTTLRRCPKTEEERLDHLNKALVYQDTLTKLGKPKKEKK